MCTGWGIRIWGNCAHWLGHSRVWATGVGLGNMIVRTYGRRMEESRDYENMFRRIRGWLPQTFVFQPQMRWERQLQPTKDVVPSSWPTTNDME
ncbi:unnamed protein product [Rhodiola kirilowii]